MSEGMVHQSGRQRACADPRRRQPSRKNHRIHALSPSSGAQWLVSRWIFNSLLELGVSSLRIDGTIGLVAPAKTPVAVVDKLRAAIRRATDGESFANSAKASGAVKHYMDAPEYGQWIQKESDRWGRVIKESGLDQAARG